MISHGRQHRRVRETHLLDAQVDVLGQHGSHRTEPKMIAVDAGALRPGGASCWHTALAIAFPRQLTSAGGPCAKAPNCIGRQPYAVGQEWCGPWRAPPCGYRSRACRKRRRYATWPPDMHGPPSCPHRSSGLKLCPTPPTNLFSVGRCDVRSRMGATTSGSSPKMFWKLRIPSDRTRAPAQWHTVAVQTPHERMRK